MKFSNKTVLFLGTSAGSVDMVRYVRANGARALVADYLPQEESEAKRYADEALLLSTADTDALVSLVRERHVDCVYAGVSEFNLLQALTVAERCGLPFYCTRDQWDAIEVKGNFRRLCDSCGVPTPHTWYVGTSVEEAVASVEIYPVVVKPVDGSASTGVYTCASADELKVRASQSKDASTSGEIIVEERVHGYEFTAHYTVHNAQASLSCIDNRYPVAVHEGSVTTVPAGRIYPSLFTPAFLDAVDPAMRVLCKTVGLQNVVLFIQGIYDPDGNRFAIFEAGLRGAGECPYRFIRCTSGVNYAEMVMDSLLAPETLRVDWPDDPFMGGKCCGCVSYVARHGTVGAIRGLKETLAALPNIIDHEVRYPVGSEVPDTDTLRQLAIRFFLLCDSREAMAKDVAYINEHVHMLDTDGHDMALKLEPARLRGLE